jgi:RHS repeat-associated protein
VIESYKYDAFAAPAIYDANGNPLSSSAKSNRFLFTGREYANAFGFYEYRARAYHPTLGRFMSEDPKLFDAGDYNLFRYCHNDPIDFTDPMGTEPPVGLFSPRQMSRWKADEEYNGIMAAAQMNSSSGAIGVAALAGTMTAQLHASVMNYRQAAGLQHEAVRKIVGYGELSIDNDGGPRGGDPKYASATSGRVDANGDIVPPEKGGRMIDSSRIPFAVAPKDLAKVNGGSLQAGDFAVVKNLRNDQVLNTQVGDFGPKGKFGEISAAGVRPLGAQTIFVPHVGLVPTMDGRIASPIPVQVTFYPGGGE